MNYQKRKNNFDEYKTAVSFVESFSNISFRKNFGSNAKDPSFFLDRTRYFLKLIGNPEKDFKYIHITGTAGKGTVSTMIHEILLADGKKAGLFTSPYVTTTIEKIKVNKEYISPDELVEYVDYLRPFIEKAKTGPYGAPSAFEIFLATAFLYFKKMKCEWVVLEVGLGGRYDATNVITNPIVTAITNIDYDHTEILGKTLRKIAYDKAGIIKKGSQFFTSEQRPVIVSFFKDACVQEKAVFNHIGKQKSSGEYNRALVTTITRFLGISEKSIEAGIRNTKLPCRFEIMSFQPTVILDGAHNRAKIRSTMDNLKKINYKRLIVIMSIANTKKDNRAIIEPLVEKADMVVITSTPKEERRSIHPKALLPYVNRYKKDSADVHSIMDSVEALEFAQKLITKDDCILVTGSFFLAGELRKKWFSEEWVLTNRRSF